MVKGMEIMFNRLIQRIKHIKMIKTGECIPIVYIDINITKPNSDKNCTVGFHPYIPNQLSEENYKFVQEHLNLVIDKIRENIDFSK